MWCLHFTIGSRPINYLNPRHRLVYSLVCAAQGSLWLRLIYFSLTVGDVSSKWISPFVSSKSIKYYRYRTLLESKYSNKPIIHLSLVKGVHKERFCTNLLVVVVAHCSYIMFVVIFVATHT